MIIQLIINNHSSLRAIGQTLLRVRIRSTVDPIRWMLLLSPLFREENWSTSMLRNLAKTDKEEKRPSPSWPWWWWGINEVRVSWLHWPWPPRSPWGRSCLFGWMRDGWSSRPCVVSGGRAKFQPTPCLCVKPASLFGAMPWLPLALVLRLRATSFMFLSLSLRLKIKGTPNRSL